MGISTDVNINVDATTPAVEKIDDATKRINQNWVAMRNQQRAVQREFELNNRTLVQTGRLLNTVGSIVQRVISVYNTWQLLQIRNQLATRNLADAQRDLRETFIEFGGTSREYQDALERVSREQEEMKRLADETRIAYALMVISILAQSGRLITGVVPKLKSATTALRNFRGATGTSASTPAPVPKGQTRLPTSTPKPSGSGSNFFSGFKGKIPSIAGGVASAGASAGLFLAGLAGEQNAFAPTAVVDPATGNVTASFEGSRAPETGFEHIGQLGKDISVSISNFINSPTSQELIEQITEATKQALTFGNQQSGGG